MMISRLTLMIRRKFAQLNLGRSEKWAGIGRQFGRISPVLLLFLLIMLLFLEILGLVTTCFVRKIFRQETGTSFETFSHVSLSPQTAVSSAVNLDIGGTSTINRQPKCNQKKTLNDKYSLYYGHIENTTEHFQEYGSFMQKRFFEIKEEEFSLKNKDVTCVKGNLKRNISFWEEIGASDFIIDVIKNGYKVPFYETPEHSFLNNNRSAKNNADFVRQAIAELLTKGCVVEVPFKPIVVNPLTVSINKQGKKRLVLDLRNPNKCVWKERIKFEDWKVALGYFEKGSFLFKFDLKSGYFHLDLAPEFHTYFGFQFDGIFYTYTVLPFGLSTAAYIFTKCLRAIVKFWRENLIRIVVFLDDGLGMNNDYQKALKDSFFVKDSLTKAGFIINEEKSIWEPQTALEWTVFCFFVLKGACLL